VTDANVNPIEAVDRTSSTLLVRIKARDQEAWKRFVRLYGPLVYVWCLRSGLQEADADDVGQDVFRTVSEAIDGFDPEQDGASFRAWLRTVTRSRVADFYRRKAREAVAEGGSEAQRRWLDVPQAPDDSGSDDEGDQRVLARRAIDLVLESCKDKTRQAFLRVVIAREAPAEVARDLEMTVNAIYLAKSHILRKFREEFAGLVDD
jgi:RNA polymerase sigma-70 factor (ECF subfamily)